MTERPECELVLVEPYLVHGRPEELPVINHAVVVEVGARDELARELLGELHTLGRDRVLQLGEREHPVAVGVHLREECQKPNDLLLGQQAGEHAASLLRVCGSIAGVKCRARA
eukprot:364277-Chlamydomonas_euryale.AAC.2